ncbi:MAG: hypothetical protein ACREX8_12485, partial [Gammaproteobacteria bacterium]
PEVCARLILGFSAESDLPDPLPNGVVRWVRKPFNLRDLHAIATEVLASTPPRSPASTAGH